VNTFQATVMQTTGWVLVLLDGWAMHTHWVAALGFVFLIYSMWSIFMKTPEDEAFEEMDKAQGWRKRQIEMKEINDAFDEEYIKYRDAFPKEKFVVPVDRNEVLEEVAKEFDKMKSLGDTAASFAAYVRGMKQ
jgi:hypothetical protein